MPSQGIPGRDSIAQPGQPRSRTPRASEAGHRGLATSRRASRPSSRAAPGGRRPATSPRRRTTRAGWRTAPRLPLRCQAADRLAVLPPRPRRIRPEAAQDVTKLSSWTATSNRWSPIAWNWAWDCRNQRSASSSRPIMARDSRPRIWVNPRDFLRLPDRNGPPRWPAPASGPRRQRSTWGLHHRPPTGDPAARGPIPKIGSRCHCLIEHRSQAGLTSRSPAARTRVITGWRCVRDGAGVARPSGQGPALLARAEAPSAHGQSTRTSLGTRRARATRTALARATGAESGRARARTRPTAMQVASRPFGSASPAIPSRGPVRRHISRAASGFAAVGPSRAPCEGCDLGIEALQSRPAAPVRRALARRRVPTAKDGEVAVTSATVHRLPPVDTPSMADPSRAIR